MNTLFVYTGWIAWILLCIVMLAKPVSLLFKGLFLKILPYRKWLGILLSIGIIIHVIVFASNLNFNFGFLIDPKFWNFTNLYGWGLLGFVVMIPLFITSNKFSIKLLGKNWKRLQKLAYIMFLAVGLHIYFSNGQWYFTLLPIGLWAVLYTVVLIKRKS